MENQKLEIHVLVTIPKGGGMVGYTHLLSPYRGTHDHTTFQIIDPEILIHLYWVPSLPDNEIRQGAMPGLEKYVNEILHGHSRFRQVTHNRPVKLIAN